MGSHNFETEAANLTGLHINSTSNSAEALERNPVANLDFSADPELNATADLLASALSQGNRGRLGFLAGAGPFVREVRAVGVGLNPAHPDRLVPLILVDESYGMPIPKEFARAVDVPALLDILLRLIPADHARWESTLVSRIPAPTTNASTGDPVSSAKRGTAGTKVRWGQSAGGSEGLLTAGHVVGNSNQAQVGNTPGNVVFARDFVGSGTRQEADIAVIDFQGMCQPASGITQSGTPSAASWIDILTVSGTKRTQVIGKLSWLYFPGDRGTAGEVYFAYPGVTTGGDSGSAAVSATNPAEVIGHVIGGSGSSGSYVQDFQYQLNVAGGVLSNLRI
jgi:hypothetical protein